MLKSINMNATQEIKLVNTATARDTASKQTYCFVSYVNCTWVSIFKDQTTWDKIYQTIHLLPVPNQVWFLVRKGNSLTSLCVYFPADLVNISLRNSIMQTRTYVHAHTDTHKQGMRFWKANRKTRQ